jgi:hypothetical protein
MEEEDKNKKNKNLVEWILRVTVGTLSFICVSVVAVLLYAFFDTRVDNDEIFKMLGPAFNTVIGAFVGLLGGISLTSKKEE